MKQYFKILMTVAAIFLAAVMVSCSNKAGTELSLSEGAQGETWDNSQSEGDAASGYEGADSADGRGADGDVPETVTDAIKETADEGPIFVHICGAVRKPDVYEVKPGDRIVDVVKMAGGFTDEADSDYHNLAGGVVDGQKIYVPTEQEVADGLVPAPELNTISASGTEMTESGANNETDAAASDKVNINTASVEQLKTLNGIGDKRAQDIIDYRSNNGDFKNIEEIKNVDGIKDGIFNKIKDSITV